MGATIMSRLRRIRALALLPLSMVPLMLAVPLVLSAPQHGRGVRFHGGDKPWPAPNVTLNDTALAYKQPPAYSGQIPVLLYHGIGSANDHYTVTQRSFALQMAFLHGLGYHSISIWQYVAWREGKHPKLPSRPILITFDDGRFDSYRGADQVLARYHMRATIYVIVGPTQRGNLFYIKWSEYRKMQKSGHWDIQFHAYNGHVQVPDGPDGWVGPFYAVREFIDGRRETVAHYHARVQGDITAGLQIMLRHGYPSPTMAVPFGEYGQSKATERSVAADLTKIIRGHFVAAFVQSIHDYTPYSSQTGPAIRYELHSDSTLGQLQHFLYGADPTVIADEHEQCRRTFGITNEGPLCRGPLRTSSAKALAGARRRG
jgi:peptidoglycan/xylan/chitin deacetylase (PgdA/CDA1 family)